MRIIYFDCFAGAAGNMILGSLLDLKIEGANKEFLEQELAKLKLPDHFDILCKKTEKHGISATYVDVVTDEQHGHIPQAHPAHADEKHENEHHTHETKTHSHTRGVLEITSIIKNSSLSEEVKNVSLSVFNNLALAEAKVHGTTPEKVVFHEVGAVDAIIDITGSVILLDKICLLDSVYCSSLNTGQLAFSKSMQGVVPSPGPATAELLKPMIVEATLRTELVTPTGAALLSTLAKKSIPLPYCSIERIGYGAGTKDLSIPNLLRAMICVVEHDPFLAQDDVLLAEANIDDLNPQLYQEIIHNALELGALDAWVTPILMKKERPAHKLSVLVHREQLSKVLDSIFKETTTFGIRLASYHRVMLDRRHETVTTQYGNIRIKIGTLLHETVIATPEYEDCKTAAKTYRVPIRRVIDAAKAAAQMLLS